VSGRWECFHNRLWIDPSHCIFNFSNGTKSVLAAGGEDNNVAAFT
jgi:hypothetical protein